MNRVISIFVLIILVVPTISFSADFDFYGIKFGNTKEEVEKVFPFKSDYGTNKAEKPGHRISQLYFTFDNNNKLINMEIYYTLGGSNESNAALLDAISDKFTEPLKRQQDIDIKTDNYTDVSKYGNTKYIILKISSKQLTNEYVKHLKSELLEKMK